MMNKYLFNLTVGMTLLLFSSILVYGQDYTDLSLDIDFEQSIGEVGETMNFTLTLTNNGPTMATDVEILVQFPTNATLGAFSGDFTDNSWTVSSLNALNSVELMGALQITAEGIGFLEAEIVEASPFDYNSTPGNGNTAENDYASACYVIPMMICPGQSVALSAPSGYDDYEWYQNGDLVSSNENEFIAFESGEYVYQCSDDNGCLIETPCPFIVNFANDCTIDLSISAEAIDGAYQVGDTVMAHFTVSNDGILDATDIQIQVEYSSNFALIGAVSTTGDFNNDVWSISSLPTGSNTQAWIGLEVTAPGAIESSAYVLNAGEPDSDSMAGNTNVFEDDYVRVIGDATEIVNLPISLICDYPTDICRLPMLMDQQPTQICLEYCTEGVSISSVETLFNCSIQSLSDSCINYLPLPLFEGDDELTFVVCTQDELVCDTVSINLTVSPNCDDIVVNNPPIAVSDNYETMLGEGLLLTPLINDYDPDGQAISLCDVLQPTYGEIEIQGNDIYYTPDDGYAGMDEFTYVICDEDGMQSMATVSIEIISPPCHPDMELCRKPFLDNQQATQLCIAFCDPTMVIQDVDADFNCSTTNISELCFSFLPLPLQEGLATVEVVGCNGEGDCETVIILVDIYSECTDDLPRLAIDIENEKIANVLSPNNDGVNDVVNFGQLLGNAVEWRMVIFDRFGSIVYEAQLGDQAFWNGAYFNEGRLLEDGTYFYQLEYSIGVQTNIKRRAGFIELRK